jgi:hypothetical protein
LKHFRLGIFVCSSLGLLGCGQESATASLRALDTSGDVSVVCLGRDADGAFTRGVDRSLCPDYANAITSPDQRRFFALVTQPLSGEVALVDLAQNANNAVVDFEPSQPGYSFMPIGADPTALVSSPGGVASFVAVREPGREGIFGLPSTCIAPRPASAPLRDIRTWPACRLPAAPGPMIIVDDPAIDDDLDPATPNRVRASCDTGYVEPAELVNAAPAANREQCPADLASETRPGRRKLLVTLPSLSEVWVMDAQALLDRTPGSFDACSVERRLTLESTTSGAPEQLPADLIPSSPSCNPVGFNHGPSDQVSSPRPADLALDDEQRLYIADTGAPVVHVLDVSDPCAVATLPPLEPLSYTDPGATITTRRVAVSPLTPSGKRFVYAVDNSDTATAGSLMAFDVSPGSTERTPLVRERAAFTPGEPPDRIGLSREVADVEFAFQDFPEPQTGVAVEGLACDPHPDTPSDSPPALYRPGPDLSTGASPLKLRGVFAFAALQSGQLAVIDVEDLDGACRRPASVNHAANENIFGCRNDDPSVSDAQGYSLLNGTPTVSNELSCNIVVPHRARSRSFFTNASGAARSAGLLAFPSLTLQTGRTVVTDQSNDGRAQPKMLGARYAANQPAQLDVGPLVYTTEQQSGNRLELDPTRADRSSLLMSYEEPRAFSPQEEFVATYEGVVRGPGQALISVDPATGLSVINEGLNAAFCTAGVQDMAVTRDVALGLGVTSAAEQTRFVLSHADYAQITADLLEEDNPYWQGVGAQCGSQLFESDTANATAVTGRALCELFFGTSELPEPNRDWRIVEAGEDRLTVEPRAYDPLVNTLRRRQQLGEFAACCFPQPSLFQVRAGNQWVVRGSASGVQHHVTADPETGRCVMDCNPLTQKLTGRVFEISCLEGTCPTDDQNRPTVGAAIAGQDVACVVGNGSAFQDGIDPGEPGSECVFQDLTTRFAIYRGQEPSQRDMHFRWQLSDGFTPLSISLTSTDRPRSVPRSLLLIPESSQLVISDGTARGLSFLSPSDLGTLVSVF